MTNKTEQQAVPVAQEAFLDQLRRVNLARYEAWIEGADAGIMFDALELGGEVGELLNVVKKLEREERGWRGSRASPEDFADECADVLICLDKLARRKGVDLAAATIAKFNATSEKVDLPHRLSTPDAPQTREAELVAALKACVKFIEDFRDDGPELLAEGVHAGLRKGSDAPDSGALHTAIGNSTTSAWSDAITFAHDPFFSMWGGDEAIAQARAALNARGGA